MSSDKIKSFISSLPDNIKDFAEAIKSNFDENGEEIIGQASGATAIVVRLFAQNTIDKYFEKLKGRKLAEFGGQTYLNASILQAAKSIEHIESRLSSRVTANYMEFAVKLTKELAKQSNNELLAVFNPKYHPIVRQVRKSFEETLRQLGETNETIREFVKNFNENINSAIFEKFGNAYEAHKKEIENYLHNESEIKLLADMYALKHIGFREGENLKYETTLGQWREVDKFAVKEDENTDETKLLELNLDFFEEHFGDNSLGKILFTIADFGKGKSVFLKQFASSLAKEYIETKDGYFPIYFNLREYKQYASSGNLGVIGDFLLSKYGINLQDEGFKHKKYYFLIDSLDESGELSKYNTTKVIESVKKIENIDKEKCRQNRIIITSRPYDGGLQNELSMHSARYTEREDRRKIYYFISIYGFKKEQFNDWLCNSLTPYQQDVEINKFIKDAFDQECNFYEKLSEVLSVSELRRPIFAYMIFQLLINKINFFEIGKIGIYLSFLNLLTKEAKHVNDADYSIDLLEEFEFRNLLHKIAALWTYERQQGKQGSLKKVDIYRAVHECSSGRDDEILEKCQKDTSMQMQFLSHSYFGENDDVLHFQHQSFAEILLAEYYLKIFIKYALDKGNNTEEARVKLMLGEPTTQTIEFLKELLKVLKGSIEDKPSALEKRKLLYPLMASLSIDKNNKLVCHQLSHKWFDEDKIKESKTAQYPQKNIENWCIGDKEIEKIIVLAKSILESDSTYIMTKAEQRTSLFDNELIKISTYATTPASDIDKWLALLVGNELETDIQNQKFFNARIEKVSVFFELIKNRNFYNRESVPEWAKDKCFVGIKMNQEEEIGFAGCSAQGINFSFSQLKNLQMHYSSLYETNFSNCSFIDVGMIGSNIERAKFDNIIEIDNLGIGFVLLFQDIMIPTELTERFKNSAKERGTWVTMQKNYKIINYASFGVHDYFNNVVMTLRGLLMYGLKSGFFSMEELNNWIELSEETKNKILEEANLSD